MNASVFETKTDLAVAITERSRRPHWDADNSRVGVEEWLDTRGLDGTETLQSLVTEWDALFVEQPQ